MELFSGRPEASNRIPCCRRSTKGLPTRSTASTSLTGPRAIQGCSISTATSERSARTVIKLARPSSRHNYRSRAGTNRSAILRPPMASSTAWFTTRIASSLAIVRSDWGFAKISSIASSNRCAGNGFVSIGNLGSQLLLCYYFLGKTGHHDYLHLRPLRHELTQLATVHPRHRQVGHQDVNY